MSKELAIELNKKANEAFENVITPVFQELIEEYNGNNGFEVKVVMDRPAITGIRRHKSIMIKHPDGMEKIGRAHV